MSFTQDRAAIASGSASCAAIVRGYSGRIESGKRFNAFLETWPGESAERAAAIDSRIASGGAGPLAGMVVAVKDIISMSGRAQTCGSAILDGYVSPYDATVIARLAAADAIVIGRTNMDEFAMGSSNENSAFGPVLNPVDETRVPGGSSGGSAAAVAGKMAHAALGTDTGGSIRQPASLTGIVGLKPTYGRVSRYGLVAFASSFDQIGPMAGTVRDAAEILRVIAGKDPLDATSADVPVDDYPAALSGQVRGLRVGLPREYFPGDLNKEVSAAIREKIGLLKAAGADIVEMSLPHTEYTIAVYYLLSTAEASSNLSRFDGIRYGRRAKAPEGLEDAYVRSRSEGFGPEVKRRIMLGTYALSAGYYDAYYKKAQQVRRLVRQDFDLAFKKVDCLITPTTPTTAFRLGERTADPLTMYLSDIFTVSANLAGIPGISVPCGADAAGLPIGLQILGKHFDEATILRVADFIERS